MRALDEFVTAWLAQGASARNVVMMEKLASLSRALSATVSGTEVDRLALMSGDQNGSGLSDILVDIASRLKAATGADPVRRYMADGGEAEAPRPAAPAQPRPATPPGPARAR